MLHTTIGKYSVSLWSSPDDINHHTREFAVATKHLTTHESRGDYVAIGVSDAGPGADLLVEGQYSPGPASGFHPGILIIPETGIVFIGVGTNVLVYNMAPISEIVHAQTEVGFWYWHQHGASVFMCAELELAVWNIDGQKRWSRPVEPPWSWHVSGDIVAIDVMGHVDSYSLQTGESI